jgi:hypothetical protein
MKLNIHNKFSLIILTGVLVFSINISSAYGQESDVQNNITKYNQNHLHEKIYVHTDRSFYLCGEALWFKAYLTNALNNHPLGVSKVAYIELLNQLHQPVLQGKISMDSGFGNGSFLLPFSFTSGNYELRAYTNWMKNDSPDNYFKKNITIINTTKNLDSTATHKTINYYVDFFPEGGNLVNGLQSEVGFKINDNKNMGINARGVIIDQLYDTLAHFQTSHFGMGHFNIMPEAGKNYSAIINCEDGTIISKTLPKAYKAGYVMHLDDAGTNDLKISVNAKGFNESNNIFIVIQNNSIINLALVQPLNNGKADFTINKDSLKDGVSQITAFDYNKQPVCERLYFKRPKNKMRITADAGNKNYSFRSKVDINVSTTDQLQKTVSGNLSVSVFRLDSLHQPGQQDIFSYLWLSSGLRGNIEDPGYYFKKVNAETNEALDNLMLTQGWRKFDWNEAFQNKTPAFKYIPENSGHIITGKITSEATNKPVSGLLIYLSVPGRRVQLKGCISDSNGLVHFDMKDFFGAGQIVMQTGKGGDSLYHLEILTPFSEDFSNDRLPAFYVSENESDDLQKENFHLQVENAYHENDLQKLKPLLIDTLAFYQKPYKTFLLDDYTRFTTMEEVLREYVDEISPRRKGDNYRLMTLNVPAFALDDKQAVIKVFENNPLVLLDGVPVFDINKIIAYDPLKVQKLEVVAAKYFWGPITAEGIASFTTYKGNLEGFKLDPHDLLMDYDGLQRQRVFYSPDYSSEKEFQSRLPDFRDVLYWSPDINTDKKGFGHFSFYTGDVPGKYWIELQGISNNGQAGSTGFLLNVSK